MAGHDDRDRVAAVRGTHRSGSVRTSDLLRDLPVAARLAVGDREQRLPDTLLEVRAAHVELEVEVHALSSEVLLELLDRACERLARAAPAGSRCRRGHVKALKTVLVAVEQELADRAWDLCIENVVVHAASRTLVDCGFVSVLQRCWLAAARYGRQRSASLS